MPRTFRKNKRRKRVYRLEATGHPMKTVKHASKELRNARKELFTALSRMKLLAADNDRKTEELAKFGLLLATIERIAQGRL